MNREKKNDYGSLCTQMYELLHPKADGRELDFYLSYAGKAERKSPLRVVSKFLLFRVSTLRGLYQAAVQKCSCMNTGCKKRGAAQRLLPESILGKSGYKKSGTKIPDFLAE